MSVLLVRMRNSAFSKIEGLVNSTVGKITSPPKSNNQRYEDEVKEIKRRQAVVRASLEAEVRVQNRSRIDNGLFG